ncbi:MAG: deoxynucleoside kinase [Chloroflexi bacterium]|nr:deoxynucleoside kinase [Chloroflexota bacterium]
MYGKLITIVGNSGVGKTTLAKKLCAAGGFAGGLEQRQEERPFQALMAADLSRYALPNQMDFLLARAEQELAMRKRGQMGLLDGGLEVDFFIFTRHFARRGYLSAAEYGLCERLYTTLRQLLPPPEAIIWLDAPVEVAMARHAARGRPLEIAQQTDLAELDELLRDWLASPPPSPIWRIEAVGDGYLQEEAIAAMVEKLVMGVFHFS